MITDVHPCPHCGRSLDTCQFWRERREGTCCVDCLVDEMNGNPIHTYPTNTPTKDKPWA